MSMKRTSSEKTMSERKYGDIRSMPNSKAFRDNFDSIFKPKREFCEHCGAGIGEHFREGEGTCEKCDPPDAEGRTRGYQGGVHKRKPNGD